MVKGQMNPLHFLGELWSSHNPVPRKRKIAALLFAGLTDILECAIFPLFWTGGASPLDLALDILTAAVLFAILGFKARLMLGFVLELVPGLTLFPTWTTLVLSLPTEAPRGEGTGEMKNVTPVGKETESQGTREPAREQPALAAGEEGETRERGIE